MHTDRNVVSIGLMELSKINPF